MMADGDAQRGLRRQSAFLPFIALIVDNEVIGHGWDARCIYLAMIITAAIKSSSEHTSNPRPVPNKGNERSLLGFGFFLYGGTSLSSHTESMIRKLPNAKVTASTARTIFIRSQIDRFCRRSLTWVSRL